MLLVIDIGNTNITVGIFRIDGAGTTVQGPVQLWRLSTGKTKTADEYGTAILDLFHYSPFNAADVSAIAIASVVPQLDRVFDDLARTYFKKNAFFVTAATKAIHGIIYDDAREVGADRIADAAAAFALYGGPAIVIDFGTATTFDCINARGDYLGGAIAPGPLISAESLAERTAKLPRVEMVRPDSVIGKSTVKSIQAGLYFGYIGLIKEILKRIKEELPDDPKIIATGGLAGLIVPEIEEVKHIAPELTLEGIRIIWERSR
jgi:type III pantothenate kinase